MIKLFVLSKRICLHSKTIDIVCDWNVFIESYNCDCLGYSGFLLHKDDTNTNIAANENDL